MSSIDRSPSGYDRPPQKILNVMNAPISPEPSLSPTRSHMILVRWPAYPPIEQLAKPYLRLAGVRLHPDNHSRRDTPGGYGIRPGATAYTLLNLVEGTEASIKLPENAFVSSPIWSADGKAFAFRNTTSKGVEIWIGDVHTGIVSCVPNVRLNPMLDDSLQWLAGKKTLVVKLVSEAVGVPPSSATATPGPKIQESSGEEGGSSTYEVRDTLTCPHDEDVFDYYATSQLALIQATTLSVQYIGEPDRYLTIEPAPDSKHLLISTIKRPYSYVTTYARFPRAIDVWNISEPSKISKQNVTFRPLADRVPVKGVPMGPRDISWRENVDCMLIWVEALDNGSWKVDVPARDKIMRLQAPFDGEPVEVMLVEQRLAGIYWGEDPAFSIVAEYDQNRQWRSARIVNIDNPRTDGPLIWNISMSEKYSNPGRPVMRTLPNGARVMAQDDTSIFFSGDGSSPKGDRPFLDRFDLQSLGATRLFRSAQGCMERFYAFNNSGYTSFFTLHQSPNDPRNVFRHVLGDRQEADTYDGEAAFLTSRSAVTHFPDPTPIVRQIKKRLVSYERHDGVKLSMKLYTPPGHSEGTLLPTLLYAYPLDYADPTVAGQTSGSTQTFTTLRKTTLLLLAGYAIIEASFPIVGDPKTAYDSYLPQLIANAKAAIDAAVNLGITDPTRVAVTGHSHGAFMTTNLLAHSDLFRAGIATSGAYNRTLMPFGFQNERRSVWEVPELYLKISPFFAADKIKTPLLLVHGEDDANPGTPPMQARLLYEALRGNGGTTRLVMLPWEPHWYAARESNEQLVFEMLKWLEQHLKIETSKL